MIGRGAQGNPWIFREIDHYLRTGDCLPRPTPDDIATLMHRHLEALHAFYGEHMGVRIARKHVGWYLATQPQAAALRARFNVLEQPSAQHRFVDALAHDTLELASTGSNAA